MFERFTEPARQVVVLAQDEARALAHNYIGTEHLLLGLLREEEGLAAQVLGTLGVTIEEGRAQVGRIVGQGDQVASGQIPFTPRSKKVLELSLREALSLGHNYIGTEHLLLGLVRENEGVAARILLDFDLDTETVRQEILVLLQLPAYAQEHFDTGRWALPGQRATRPALLEMSASLREALGAALDSIETAKKTAKDSDDTRRMRQRSTEFGFELPSSFESLTAKWTR